MKVHSSYDSELHLFLDIRKRWINRTAPDELRQDQRKAVTGTGHLYTELMTINTDLNLKRFLSVTPLKLMQQHNTIFTFLFLSKRLLLPSTDHAYNTHPCSACPPMPAHTKHATQLRATEQHRYNTCMMRSRR